MLARLYGRARYKQSAKCTALQVAWAMANLLSYITVSHKLTDKETRATQNNSSPGIAGLSANEVHNTCMSANKKTVM